MADKLIFPIGFDLEEGVAKVEKDWGKMQKRLQDTFKSQTIQVDADISKAVLDKLYAKFEGLIKTMESKAPQIKLKIPDTVDFEQEINRLKVQLKSINLGELTDAESKDLYLYIRQLEALAKALKEVNKQEQLRQANRPEVIALKQAQAEEKRTRSLANSALAEQRRAKIATESARQDEINNRSAQRGAVIAEQKRAATARAENAELRLTRAKERSTQATHEQNTAYKTQSTYLSRLVQRMVAYASVAQAFSFLRNVRDVTAQFELQRVALGSIIGDLNEANAMFEQIKAAAVKSPFQIKELVTYTKQLAAYKIESDELFETTQKLADVSAGLGVGMERLVLAYGQIRATGYLRASEVRQLTEAGIPIVEELAKKMSQLRGETVSAAEVMGMISERAISFGMVKEVFDDMTSAGGMFYKMQEKQAETLAGQWSNLQDAISIMYEEIGNTEGVNNSIKGTIGLVKSLAENWRDVASVSKAVIAGMIVYMTMVKNATIATKALSVAEAQRNAVTSMQLYQMPKILSMFLTENAAKKVNIFLSKQMYAARLKEVTATNVLSKALAKLRIAMLSNPYTAVLAVITAIGIAIWNFAKKVKTTEERIEDLNKSVASLTDLKNDVKPLVDELDELSQKPDKTIQEQERLARVVKELANQYPSATFAVQEYGKNVKIAASEVNKLYEAELKVKEKGLRAGLTESEKALEKLKKEREAIIGIMNKGVVIPTTPIREVGKWIANTLWKGITNEEIPFESHNELSDKTLNELVETLSKIDDEIKKLTNSITRTKVALGDIPTEASTAIESFGSWKKTIKDFKTGLKNELGEDVNLFEDDIINQFTDLNDALSKVAEQYTKNDDAIKGYSQTLTSKKLTQAERKDIENKKARAEAFRNTAYSILEYYNATKLLDKKGGGDQDESQLSILQKELQLHEKIYAKYKEYRKYMSAEQAKMKVEDYFGDTIKALQFTPKYDKDGYKQVLKQYQDVAKNLPDSDKVVMEIGFKINDADWQDAKDDIEKNLKRLSDQISRTKTAKEFFDRMLGLTGDKQLSATLTLSVYGTTGDDLKSALVKQVEQAFKGVNISGAIDYNTMTINYQKLAEIYAKNQDKILDANKSMAESIVKDGQKTSASQIEQWAKELEAVKTYADKRVDIARQTQQRISEIETSTLPEDEKQRLQEQYRKKEEKDLAKLEYQAFKESPMYVAMFDNLDSASTTMLNNMRAKLMELKEAWGSLDMPTELKEMQSRLNEIDKQLAKHNPFKTLANGYQGYQKLREQGSRKEAEQDLIDKTEAHAKALQDLKLKTNSATFAQNNYNDAVAKFGKESEQAKDAMAFVEKTNKLVESQKEIVNTTEDAVEASQELVNKWKELDDVVGGAWEQADMLTQAIINLGRNLADAFGGFGSDADAEFFDTLMTGFGNLASGITSIGKGIASGDPIAIINGIGSAISGLAGLFTAGTVHKADKEIERQQELIDRLSKSYDKLKEKADSAYGSEFFSNIEARNANLQAQIEAYEKQIEAERSKGKKADADKIKDIQESIDEANEAIAESTKELSERLLGTDLGSAAREFANAWLDAYDEFGNTAEAIEGKFRELIRNMIVEAVLGAVMKKALKPVFDMIENMDSSDIYDPQFWKDFAVIVDKSSRDADTGANNAMQAMENLGAYSRDFGKGLTGISKDIASASEESILGLAAGINTQNFYISQVPPKLDVIIGLLQGGNLAQGSAITLQDLVTIQNQHLSYLPSIAQHTAETVTECKQIVAETRRTADALERVIKPRGTQATHTVNTSL